LNKLMGSGTQAVINDVNHNRLGKYAPRIDDCKITLMRYVKSAIPPEAVVSATR
jgi:hypothetical protein